MENFNNSVTSWGGGMVKKGSLTFVLLILVNVISISSGYFTIETLAAEKSGFFSGTWVTNGTRDVLSFGGSGVRFRSCRRIHGWLLGASSSKFRSIYLLFSHLICISLCKELAWYKLDVKIFENQGIYCQKRTKVTHESVFHALQFSNRTLLFWRKKTGRTF